MPDYWGFGQPTGGGWQPPFGGGPSTGVPAGGQVPWWLQAGIYIADQAGAFDWAAENIFGQDSGGGGSASGNGGYSPTTASGMPLDFVSSYLQPNLLVGTGDARQRALQSYEDNPDVMSRFLDWLKTLGAVTGLLSKLATGSIFDWPLILQDLILLFYHNQGDAVEIGPVVVQEANRNVAPTPTYGGSFGGALAAYAPPIIPAEPVIRVKSRKGYVVVTNPMTGEKALMKKSLAVAAGLHKSRKKAPITGREWAQLKTASRLTKKLGKMSKDMGCNTTTRRRR